jgi:tetratricopeptide (TPR) repeat protein
VRGKLPFGIAAVALFAALTAGCTSTTSSTQFSPKQSWTDKLASGFKSGSSKLAAMGTPDDHIERENILAPKKKPSPGPYVALGELQERQGDVAAAEAQFQKALAIDPNYLPAMLAYAHLEDRQRNFQAALRFYNRALKKHHDNASVHNDMGLCLHRHNKLNDAAKSLSEAVERDPDSKLYRANLAAVYVDQGKTSEALEQLVHAHGQPVGHYNLAYLLMQKKETTAALHHFKEAARLDPTFGEARQWVAQLAPPVNQFSPAVPQQPAVMVARREPSAPYAPGSIVAGGARSPYPNTVAPTAGGTYPETGQAGTSRLPGSNGPTIYR